MSDINKLLAELQAEVDPNKPTPNSAQALPFKEITSSVVNITKTDYATVLELPLAGYNFIRPRFDSLHFEGMFNIHVSGLFK
jgi:hypothetical protein